MSYNSVGVLGKNCTLHLLGKNIAILGAPIVSLFYVHMYNSMTWGFLSLPQMKTAILCLKISWGKTASKLSNTGQFEACFGARVQFQYTEILHSVC